jgi:uncharacterized damage-inducible protein DinB
MIVSEVKHYPPYFENYFKMIPRDTNLLELFKNRNKAVIEFFESIPADKWNYQYAEGKWSVKKILRHIIDAELIFSYRALCFARGESQPLPGWSENEYADATDDAKLHPDKLIKSLKLQLESTQDMFHSFDEADLNKIGNANGSDTEIGAIGFAIIAHEMHHRKVILEKYL